ncbi:MAG: hypothetical protein AAF798_14030 [Bacteroidota bacterium]
MALLRFFRVPKHQQYDYKPRYWDPKKEELKERLAQIEQLKNNDAEAAKARISSGFRRGYQANNVSRKGQVLRSNLVLLAIVGILVVFTYMFLTVYLPEIVNMVESKGVQ